MSAIPHEECRRGAHLPALGREPIGGKTTKVCDTWPVQCQTQLPSQPQGITTPWPVPNYAAWWQRHVCVCVCEQLAQELSQSARAGVEPMIQQPDSESDIEQTETILCVHLIFYWPNRWSCWLPRTGISSGTLCLAIEYEYFLMSNISNNKSSITQLVTGHSITYEFCTFSYQWSEFTACNSAVSPVQVHVLCVLHPVLTTCLHQHTQHSQRLATDLLQLQCQSPQSLFGATSQIRTTTTTPV